MNPLNLWPLNLVSISKLVYINGNDIGVVVELDESLKSLAFESGFHLSEGVFLDLLDGLVDGALVCYGCPEHPHGRLHDVRGQVRLHVLELSINSRVNNIFIGFIVASSSCCPAGICHDKQSSGISCRSESSNN